MNIAVFTDKFSGTLSAYEVIDVIKENFANSNIEAEVNYFTNIFECGAEGLKQPRKYLSEATKELIKTFQKD